MPGALFSDSGRGHLGAASLVAALVVLHATTAEAGPPYVTDDPEPVEHRHWEVYLASQTEHDKRGWTGTAPHVEVNYGVITNVQLHVIAPLAYSVPTHGSSAYGVGDVELGIKFRFLEERKWTPMIGTFPLVEVPAGSRSRGLGNGAAQVLLPVWLQKSAGAWTTYGGWGVWFDSASEKRPFWLFGWLVQRQFFDRFTIGAELFHTTPDQNGAESDTRFNLGGTVDFGKSHHLLLSAGRSIVGPDLFQAYLAYQLTVGPWP